MLGKNPLPAPESQQYARESCHSCNFSRLCLPVGLDGADVERLDSIVVRRRRLGQGQQLYRSGARFHAVFAIRTGTLKSYLLTEDGSEQIIGFYLPGDFVGLDGVGRTRYRTGATALEASIVCEIPFARLETLASRIPDLQHRLLRIMGEEIFSEQELVHALGRRDAESRLALALLSLAQRYARRGHSPLRFRLPMARAELANFLGLTPETVSRLFRRFIDNDWISARGRELTLRDPEALRRLGGMGDA